MKSRFTEGLLVLMMITAIGAATPVAAQAPPPECSDGADNDSDGATDFPDDSGCVSAEDDSEASHVDIISFVTIRFAERTDVFRGRVRSSSDACKVNRAVIVKKAVRGEDKTIWRAATDEAGRWRTKSFPRANGRYYALLPEAAIRTAEGYVSCGRSDRSDTIRV